MLARVKRLAIPSQRLVSLVRTQVSQSLGQVPVLLHSQVETVVPCGVPQ